MHRLLLIFLFFCLPATAQETIIAEESEDVAATEEPVIQKKYTSVKMRGLNKITTRSERINATMGAVTRFGNLEIIPRGCWVAPADKRPEQASLLEVWYWKQGEKPSMVFFGWMFASSPALSSLEHPVYDLTMLECVEDKTQQPKQPPKQPDANTNENPEDDNLEAPVVRGN